jgi:catechol 2,3-dioxygenase-like lactoylglutathione lyase family enzyme
MHPDTAHCVERAGQDRAPPGGSLRDPPLMSSAAGIMTVMIGQLDSVIIDCPDPRALAGFYCELLGMHVVDDDDGWVTIRTDSDAPSLAFQKASDLRSPSWPDPARPQQFHLDVRVDDIETAERRVITAGATRLAEGGGETFRVYADPVGHPFCLVW